MAVPAVEIYGSQSPKAAPVAADTLVILDSEAGGVLKTVELGNLDLALGILGMALQASSAVAITGGTIDGITATNVTMTSGTINGVAIGAVTASTIAGTTGTFSGDVTVSGSLTAVNLIGNGAAITGITGATGGVSNTGSTTLAADTDVDGVGVIALQTRNVTRITIENAGSVTFTGAVTGITTATVTTAFRAPVGSVGTPSYSVTGDTNTGIYFPAADRIGIAAGGAQVGLWTSTGLNATIIGATTPAAITGTTVTQSGDHVFTSTTGTIRTNAIDGTDDRQLMLTAGSTFSSTRSAGISLFGNEVSASEGRLLLFAGNTATKGDVLIQTGGSGRLNINYAGNVGFNTTDLEAWPATYSALQLGAEAAIMYRTTGAGGPWIFSNAYYDGTNKYRTTAAAGRYYQSAGQHVFEVAASGTIDTAITWTTALTITNAGSTVLGSAALATTATAGFLYIPTCAGTPTGVPNAHTGRVPMIYDTTANKFWIYSGSWRGVVLS